MSRVPRTQGPPCLDAQAGGRGDAVAGDLERIVGSIGLKVFSLRKRMGLSLQQLGKRSDVSAAAIHKIEKSGMTPTIASLMKVASALGKSVGYFVEEIEATRPVTAGKVKAAGTHTELVASDPLYAELAATQFLASANSPAA